MFRNVIGGAFFLICLYLTAFLGAIFIGAPFLPTLLIKPSLWRYFVDRAVGLWLALPPALLEVIFNVKVRITGDQVPSNKESSLIIMNHRCRLDWMFYWLYLHRHGDLSKNKIILKYDLKNIPGAGWAMQGAMFLFLKRRWEFDREYLNRVLSYFVDINYPVQLLLFPEGTNFMPEMVEKSDNFAQKNGLPSYKYCLHPRVRGFTFIAEKLRHTVDAIHDVTVGYPVNLCYGEMDLFFGNFPKEVHFHIQRYTFSDHLKDVTDMGAWCEERWSEKEKRLERFYEDKQFEKLSFEGKSTHKKDTLSSQKHMYSVLLFWLSVTIGSFYLVFSCWIVRWYLITAAAYMSIQSVFLGGIDALQLYSHDVLEKQYSKAGHSKIMKVDDVTACQPLES